MKATYLLQLTRSTSQQETSSTQQADAPSLDTRNIRITKNHPRCYIGYPGDEHEPANDNAYFASEALEHKHAYITLNDKVLLTLDCLFGRCIDIYAG
jgi:hypothetical protein